MKHSITPQPWIRSPQYDGLFILLPPFLSLAIVACLPEPYKTTAEMPLIGWLLLVVLVDVAHVYSTLFRTYLDQTRFRRQRSLFIAVPLICYGIGVGLYSLNGSIFWRILAYLAVFHFIRQQYGFMRLYARSETSRYRWIDTAVIYYATIYPLIYWHLSPTRNFNWFVDDDFWQTDWPLGRTLATWLYGLLLIGYLLKEGYSFYQTRQVNIPRNLLIAGTLLSWYFGIIYFNGDLAFTLLNVVSHGIPYLALIWLTNPPASGATHQTTRPLWMRLAFFLGIVSILAYLEEGLWDGFVWREHSSLFVYFQALPTVQSDWLLALLVPLLSLPQATHYVLDGFIWRRESV